jgi:hypothetical protein
MKLDPAHASALLDRLRQAADPAEALRLTNELLDFLRAQLGALGKQANGYPGKAINMAVWMAGSDLACLADAVADELNLRQLPVQEELAAKLATALAFEVKSHYPQEIFPRVLRHARCREAIGDLPGAIGNYQAILADFDEMGLDEWLQPELHATDAWEQQALKAARAAADRLITLDSGDVPRWRALRDRLDQGLAT